ncbi:MAG: PAS domain S-box protein [Acidimicrobiales bacterium]
MTTAANESSTVDDAMHEALGAVCAAFAWPVGHYYHRSEDDAGQLVPAPVWHLDDGPRFDAFRRVSDALRLRLGQGLPGRVAATGRPVWISDLGVDENFHRARWATEAGLVAGFGFPVLVGAEVVGVLEFFSSSAVVAEPQLVEVMNQVGTQLGRVVERSLAVQALADSEERMRLIVETASDAFVGMDPCGAIVAWNGAAEALFGWSRAEAIGARLADTIIPIRYRAAHDQGLARFLDTGEAAVFGQRLELQALHRDGHEVPMELSIWPVHVGSGIRFNAFVRDISDRRQAQAATERFQIAFDDAPIGMVLTDVTGRFLQANRAYCEMLGYSEDELSAMTFADITPDDELATSMEQFERLVAGEMRTYRIEKRYVHADGHLVWVLLNVSAVPAADGGIAYVIGQIEDISERKEFEAKLARQALHDPLTGLPNRLLLMDRLRQAIWRAERDGGSLALMFVDLDHFKQVNDSLGHEAGDGVLATIAQRLRASLRPADTAARLGGDEFVILCERVDEQETRAITGRVTAAVDAPCVVGAHEVTVTASVGVVMAGPAPADAEALLREADAAMYRAKAAGKGRSEIVEG